jgi:hypothetical protein
MNDFRAKKGVGVQTNFPTEVQVVIDALCNAMEKLPAHPPDRAAEVATKDVDEYFKPSHQQLGKLYEEIIVNALVMRLNTLPRPISLHEFFTGEAPDINDSSYFATTRVQPFRDPATQQRVYLKKLPGYYTCPRAAACFKPSNVSQRIANNEEARKKAQNVRDDFQRHIKDLSTAPPHNIWSAATSTGFWGNFEFYGLPKMDDPQPYYGIFPHPFNTVHDGFLMMNGEEQDQPPKRLYVGVQCKERADVKLDSLIKELTKSVDNNWRQPAVVRHFSGHTVVTLVCGVNAPNIADPRSGVITKREGISQDEDKPWFYMHHDDVRRWCPSVAYSACDAHPFG